VEVIVVACVAPVVAVALCILFTLTSKFQSLLVFGHWNNWPPFDPADLTRPSSAWARRLVAVLGPAFRGLPQAVPFTATGPKGTLRGLRVPRTAPGHHVVLYLHGNAGNVATGHRVALYKLLTAPPFCCDVVAIDYAGFGQSDGVWPDEESAVRDALAALEALPDRRSDVIVWGHSLGTGIAVGAMARLLGCSGTPAATAPAAPSGRVLARGREVRDTCTPLAPSEEGSPALDAAAAEPPRGLILEAPFLSVPDAAVGVLSRCRRPPRLLLRALRNCLSAAIRAHRMPSHERIAGVAGGMPVAMLHGLRDSIIPFEQGQQLASLAGAPLHSFDCGHEDIVRDPKLVEVLKGIFREWEAPLEDGGVKAGKEAVLEGGLAAGGEVLLEA